MILYATLRQNSFEHMPILWISLFVSLFPMAFQMITSKLFTGNSRVKHFDSTRLNTFKWFSESNSMKQEVLLFNLTPWVLQEWKGEQEKSHAFEQKHSNTGRTLYTIQTIVSNAVRGSFYVSPVSFWGSLAAVDLWLHPLGSRRTMGNIESKHGYYSTV